MKHDSPIVPTNPQKQRRKTSGFSLIELLIAMALLLILAALAVPNYLAAMARANEASAASSVRAIISAENLYRNTFGTFTDMPNLGVDYLTDSLLSAGQKSGYMFDATPRCGHCSRFGLFDSSNAATLHRAVRDRRPALLWGSVCQ